MYCNGLLRNKDIYTFNPEAMSEWVSDQLLVYYRDNTLLLDEIDVLYTLDFHTASSLKQLSSCTHITPLTYNILTLNTSLFLLLSIGMSCRGVANTNFIIIEMTRFIALEGRTLTITQPKH